MVDVRPERGRSSTVEITMSNVSEFLVDTLIANGVGRVWGLPGDSLNGVTDAIRTRPAIQWMRRARLQQQPLVHPA